jgi:hypothetical protein
MNQTQSCSGSLGESNRVLNMAHSKDQVESSPRLKSVNPRRGLQRGSDRILTVTDSVNLKEPRRD